MVIANWLPSSSSNYLCSLFISPLLKLGNLEEFLVASLLFFAVSGLVRYAECGFFYMLYYCLVVQFGCLIERPDCFDS